MTGPQVGGHAVLASLLALAGCGGTVATEPHGHTPPRASAAAASPPERGSSAPATAAPPAAVPPLPRYVVQVETLARCPAGIEVFPVGRSWFGMCGGAFNQGSAFVIDESGAVHAEPRLLDGLPANASFRAAGGASIATLEVAIDTPGIRGEQRSFLRRRGNRWVDLPFKEVPEAFIGVNYSSPWTLQLDGYELGQAPYGGELRATGRGPAKRWLPQRQVGSGGEKCPNRIPMYFGMAREGAGVVWGVGATCDGGLAAERFEIGKAGSTVEAIFPPGVVDPGSPWDEGRGLIASGKGLIAYASHGRERAPSGEVRVLQPPLVARREGGRWNVIDATAATTIDDAMVAGNGAALMRSGARLFEVGAKAIEPVLTGVESLFVAPDGSAWAPAERGLFRWIDGRLEQVVLESESPGEKHVVDVKFTAERRALVVADVSGRDGTTVLLRETAKGAPRSANALELTGEEPLASPFASYFPVEHAIGGVQCATALVLLYRLSRTAPADYDFPATRAALKGQVQFADASFVELDAIGERHFAAVIRGDVDLARALAKRIQTKVPGSKPIVFCEQAFGSPLPIKRTLDIDLATGELRKPSAAP